MSNKLIMGEQYILPENFVGLPGGGTLVRVVAEFEGSMGCVPEALYDPMREYDYWDGDVFCIAGNEVDGCRHVVPAAPPPLAREEVRKPDASALTEYDVWRLWDTYTELRKAGRYVLIGDLVEAFRELRGY